MNEFNILCCPDNNYTPYCGIMLTSLFENNKETGFTIYIVTANITSANKEQLEQLCKSYNNRIEIIEIDNKILDNCPIREGDHVSIAAYYRIFAPILLPEEINKILYLDGDIIINNSIADFYNTNIDNYALGGIIDEDYLSQKKYNRLGIPFNKEYINSGVLLINLKYWREHNLTDKCLSYIDKNKKNIVQHDQDVLNAVLNGNIKQLPLKYNFQTGFLFKNVYPFDDKVKNEISDTAYNPTVIHYTTIRKPWVKRCQHPYRNHFHYYRKKSLWKNTTMIDSDSLKAKFIYYLANIVWTLGLKKRQKPFIIDTQKKV